MTTRDSSTGFVVAGLLLGILITAMDNTIVATALGTIVSELGGMEEFIWVTSAYMVTVMAGTPIFGKLSDMYGRKRFFLFGMILFLIGSVLCGTANSITQLSIYRAIQGIGGGALMPIAFTIVFDIFPPEKRGKMSGLIGSVFGFSSIFGPLLGAYITEYFGWHWVFFISLPIGAVSLALVLFFYHESHEHLKQKIDWGGAVTLVGAIVSLMFALELGGQRYPWDSGVILGLFGAFAVLFALFLYVETKATEPILSYAMFRNRLFASSNTVAFLYGATFVIGVVLLPIFVQGVYGGTATNSGIILMPMMLGSVVGSQVGGMLAVRMSYRSIMLISALFFISGIFLLGTITPDTPRIQLTLYMILTGFGIGFSFSVLSMASIHHFDMRQRGAATSANSFMRSLGMTLGITIYGIIQRNLFTSRLSEQFSGMSAGGVPGAADPRDLLSPEKRAQLPPEVLQNIVDALASSIAQTFRWALIPAGLALLFIFTMSGERLKQAVKQTKPYDDGK